ncbi:DNA polymerase IV [Blastomyces dermatitidis ATCC 18188]|uniref:DNA-directed DNA polymerase n=1 Tax=Ajellomyces dermatitidis (strain ATCC 18188 / CBS 674.68) TaxID=653446 RepID=F2TFE4_AJEDA|nr:DNA polymerase IV [Blastomyces dermatitidis ATCC 18188]
MPAQEQTPTLHYNGRWIYKIVSPCVMTTTKTQSKSSGTLAKTISLASLPSIYVLPTHLDLDQLHEVEETLERCGAQLTYDISEAELVLGKVLQKRRAAFELRSRGLWTEEVSAPTVVTTAASEAGPSVKRRRVSGVKDVHEHEHVHVQPAQEPLVVDLRMESEGENVDAGEGAESRPKRVLKPSKSPADSSFNPKMKDGIIILKFSWLDDSLKAGHAVPLAPYIVYHARKVAPRDNISVDGTSSNVTSVVASPRSPLRPRESPSRAILERAKADAASSPAPNHFSPGTARSRRARVQHGPPAQKEPPRLLRETTEEHEAAETGPPTPAWVRDKLIYACQRSAFLNPPNEAFINQLIKIKKIRELTLDEIGVRAYSTAIAAIAAYPYKLQSPKEVSTLPGCESKIAILFSEFNQSKDGTLESANQLDTDPVLSVLNQFYNIWGVGAKTARDFYYHYHWRSIDDVIEQGWNMLSRVQQIGIKYFDEFMAGIPRSEVESIADIVLQHAKQVRPHSQKDYDGKGIECIIVGGYRRGKEVSGDVDLILSHRDERVTHNLVYDVVASLEKEGWITHTLALHLTTSHREQQTAPYRGDTGGKPRFDSLDKALVVWQNPHFEARKGEDGNVENEKRNPNPHRRVDIIISPWRTVGCAIVGWTGETTFERDLRRYAKKVHNWKFDSSGVRSRSTGGQVIDLEGKGSTWQEREKLVLEGIGVGWRPPEERCTR